MDDRADHSGAIAIIGLACRFPGAAEPAEFHDLIVAGRRMFRPLSGGAPPLHAAPLDDWSAGPGSYDDHGAGAQDTSPVQKLAAETTALALADAGLRDLAGMLPEAAARLLDDPSLRARLSAAATDAVRAYDWPMVARDVVKVYEAVVPAAVGKVTVNL